MKRTIEEVISSAFDAISRKAYDADQVVDHLVHKGAGPAQIMIALITVGRDLLDANARLEDQLESAEKQIEFQSEYISTLQTFGRGQS